MVLTGPARRWSGDMNTSLGNTISNLLCLRTALKLAGEDPDRVIVEGDDSLVHVEHPARVPEIVHHLESMGLITKPIEFDSPGEAGFCHL